MILSEGIQGRDEGMADGTTLAKSGSPKSRPILFSGAMVRAILDGKKTQTRRDTCHGFYWLRGPWELTVRVWWHSFTIGVVVLGSIVDIHLGFITVIVRYDWWTAERRAERKAEAKALKPLLALLGPRQCEGVE